MVNFNWTCPFCNRDTVITDDSYVEFENSMSIPCTLITGEHRQLQVICRLVVCPNKECREVIVVGQLNEIIFDPSTHRWLKNREYEVWQLRPASNAKPFPSYIPAPIREDYTEACLIRDRSPKASATLSRRCLQGMIRDFWGIRKSRLVDEIEELKVHVEPAIWNAIDAVRKIGNIGAHMEKDVNLLVDVEPKEAGMLINLIEELLSEWYVRRHEREKNFQAVVDAAAQKDIKKNSAADPRSD